MTGREIRFRTKSAATQTQPRAVVCLTLKFWAAGAGLSGAKEVPGFRTATHQPRPTTNPMPKGHQIPIATISG